ncbi:hypothetical protein BGZ93_006149 [Podila epicladia]|nr:hypothetical protein BGZ93_006149 [Podila epicladia]
MKFATASLVTLLAVVLAAGSVQASRCVKNCVNIDGYTEAECLWMCVKQDCYYGCIRQGNQPIDCRNNCQLP